MKFFDRRQEDSPPPLADVKTIIGGTCSICGEYDPNATESYDGLLCSDCVDGERDTDLEISAEEFTAEKKHKGWW